MCRLIPSDKSKYIIFINIIYFAWVLPLGERKRQNKKMGVKTTYCYLLSRWRYKLGFVVSSHAVGSDLVSNLMNLFTNARNGHHNYIFGWQPSVADSVGMQCIIIINKIIIDGVHIACALARLPTETVSTRPLGHPSVIRFLFFSKKYYRCCIIFLFFSK